jgi:hypothetical protein
MDGFVNGEAFRTAGLTGFCPAGAVPGILAGAVGGKGRVPTHIELWLHDSQNRYDSVYGRNYHFDF